MVKKTITLISMVVCSLLTTPAQAATLRDIKNAYTKVARALREQPHEITLTDEMLEACYRSNIEPLLKKEEATQEVKDAWKEIAGSLFESMKKGRSAHAAVCIISKPLKLITNIVTISLVIIMITVFSLGALTGVALAIHH